MTLLLTLLACMPASYRIAKALEGRYVTGDPGAGWVVSKPGGADKAWYNEALGASIYADSNCGPRYQETRVEDLATELIIGLHDTTTDIEQQRAIGNREGILRTHTGSLDGVNVRVGVAVVNRDACTYDFVYIGQIGSFDDGWAAYEAVLDGFSPK